jgi:hypothetical protein
MVLDNCACPFIDTEFMITLESFKAFMMSDAVPNYVFRYCSTLCEGQWEWFYGQMIYAIEFTDEPEYLFYTLKWILKFDYDDLVYEMYCQDIMDPECRKETLIKSSKWTECCNKYHERFEQDFADMWRDDADNDDDAQELPF